MREPMDRKRGAIPAFAFDVQGVNQSFYQTILSAYSDIENSLVEFKSITNKMNCKAAVFFTPCRFMISDHASDNLRNIRKNKRRLTPLNMFAEMCAKHNILFIDAGESLKTNRALMLSKTIKWDNLYLDADMIHLNETGHKLIAQALKEKLFTPCETVFTQ